VHVVAEADEGDIQKGVNEGSFQGDVLLDGNTGTYHDSSLGCVVSFTFNKDELVVNDHSAIGCWGQNVTFSGTYKKQ
jgi:hypothetical protein